MTSPAKTPQQLVLERYRPDIAAELHRLDCPRFRHAQVASHLFRRPTTPFSEASSLPADLRIHLDELGASMFHVKHRLDDNEGTTKLLLEARDGSRIETVVMRSRDRTSVCVSTQVGCALRCVFCATGAMGFVRNLTTAEIVDQVRIAEALVGAEALEGAEALTTTDGESARPRRRVSHVVFMGMGEPLLNTQATLDSLFVLKDPEALDLRQRGLSVSTVGIPEGIHRLARQEPQVNLALSLHTANDALRSRLMPINRRYPLKEVMRAVDDHFEVTHRKLLVEYLLLKGINDSLSDANALARLLTGRMAVVNLIPWNPIRGLSGKPEISLPRGGSTRDKTERHGRGNIGEGKRTQLVADSIEEALQFKEHLDTRGVRSVLRKSRGLDIQAACGQLATSREHGRKSRAPRSRG